MFKSCKKLQKKVKITQKSQNYHKKNSETTTKETKNTLFKIETQ